MDLWYSCDERDTDIADKKEMAKSSEQQYRKWNFWKESKSHCMDVLGWLEYLMTLENIWGYPNLFNVIWGYQKLSNDIWRNLRLLVIIDIEGV